MRRMEHVLRETADAAALVLECIAVVLVVWGTLVAVTDALGHIAKPRRPGWRRQVWVSLGVWLLLALQFALGADIVRSVIAPTWNDIGQLAAIAVIRTFLNHFLEQEIGETRREMEQTVTPGEAG